MLFFHVLALELILPPWLNRDYGGSPLWAWLALVVIGACAVLLARLASGIICTIAKRAAGEGSRRRRLVDLSHRPIRLLLGIGLFHLGRRALPLAAGADAFLHAIEIAIGTCAIVWCFVRAADFASGYLGSFFDKSGRSHAKAVIPLLRKVIQAAIVLLGLVFLLQNVGIDVGAILAGLGIGGLALALAGKRTVEDLFAGVTLVVDQPARVGDFCKFDGGAGTIEDIGLRSTRVRTAERTLLTIPNAKLCEMKIENLAPRDRILLKTPISLVYETTSDQLKEVLDNLRSLLTGRGDIASGHRVRFVAFTKDSLDLEMFAYVTTSDFPEFLRVREEIFIGIMDVVAASGTAFASPSPPVMLVGNPGQQDPSGGDQDKPRPLRGGDERALS